MGEMSRKVNKKGDKWRGKETDDLVGIVTENLPIPCPSSFHFPWQTRTSQKISIQTISQYTTGTLINYFLERGMFEFGNMSTS